MDHRGRQPYKVNGIAATPSHPYAQRAGLKGSDLHCLSFLFICLFSGELGGVLVLPFMSGFEGVVCAPSLTTRRCLFNVIC